MSKLSAFFFLLMLSGTALLAQDIVLIEDGDFVRGTVTATNFSSVILKNEDGSLKQYEAKNIKEFVWNGETYVSKPILISKRMEFRFFKLLEYGAVNLYAIGGTTSAPEPKPKKRAKVRPSVSIGAGSGGFGGVGLGGGVSIGGGRGNETPVQRTLPVTYFVEKVGTGPLMELMSETQDPAAVSRHVKDVLLQKLTGEAGISERIRSAQSFDAQSLRNIVIDYNASKK